jgi:hypothetical protein
MPRLLQMAFAVFLYAAIMASVAQTVLRWGPQAAGRSMEQLAAEVLTIRAWYHRRAGCSSPLAAAWS